MPLLLQFLTAYAAALLVAVVVGSKDLDDVWPITITYGIVAFPFALVAGAVAKLLERWIGWPAAMIAVLAIFCGMYLLAPHKGNFWRGFDSVLLSGMTFAAVWCYFSWRGDSGTI